MCQEPTVESQKCPATSKDVTGIAKIYIDAASLLKRFQEADKLFHKQHFFQHQMIQEKLTMKKVRSGTVHVKVRLPKLS